MTFPENLCKREWWVVWDFDEEGRKRPRAPWLHGHSYPAKWGADVDEDERPETDYETAMMYTDLPASALQSHAPAPTDDIDLKAGVILPHANDNNILFVDLDDVRDPETGELTSEARAIVRRLDTWTEVSVSGTGLHMFVFGELPNHTRFIADLDQAGHIEIYKQARFFGLTGDRLADTPDTINDAHGEIGDITERYEPRDGNGERRDSTQTEVVVGECSNSPATSKSALYEIQEEYGEISETSPYYDLKLSDVVTIPSHFDRERAGPYAGPHPVHGPKHSDPADCTNTAIWDGEIWYCHLHGASGGPLQLRAIDEGIISCGDRTRGNDSWTQLTDSELLDVCRAMRDAGEVDEDAKPPYRALRALADEYDLEPTSDEKLGAAYAPALTIYQSEKEDTQA